ncbi:MAG TPA: putative peptidoglycan glycosyltransferase FtsW [Stellaceae bacterium]|nr:putative peptidoglycan glycosyltransferase FtsW [Stellaceae bacterium]
MMFARIDQRPVARWWWTIDRLSLGALALLIAFGAVLSMAASPAVAERLGYAPLHFVERQMVIAPVAFAIMFGVSLLPPRGVRRVAFVGFAIALALLALTFVVGVEIKGARRWIDLPGLSIQPSEFVKPTFTVVAAWLFAEQKARPGFPGNAISIALFLGLVAMLVKQPDIGMAVVVAVVWFAQFFMAGLRLYWAAVGTLAGLGGLAGAYLWLPHVTSRINRFLDPAAGDSYQVNRSIEAFVNGGLWGRGPGEGTVKDVLPDAHADFVFAVAGEEFGLIVCVLIVGVFAFIVLRGFSRLLQEGNLFVVLSATGLLIQFGLQAIINMASTLHLIPTKGMTLPFLSYGGSSMLALGLGMGMMLALTRRRLGGSEL